MLNRNNTAKLINSLENLTHSDRILQVIELGKQAKTDPNAATIIDELQAGNHYERMLAMHSCYGSYDGERVLTAIRDSSRSVRKKAVNLISVVGSDTQVLSALEISGYKQRRQLFIFLKKRNRQQVIDSFIGKLIEQKDRELALYLVYGSPEIVNLYLDTLLDRTGANDWRNLVKLHPTIAVTILQRYGRKTSQGISWQFVFAFNDNIAILSELAPDSALELLKSLIDHRSFIHLNFQKLIYYRPVEVARLVTQLDSKRKFGRYTINFNSVAHKLPQDILINLIENRLHLIDQFSTWLPKLKPEQRIAIYEYCYRGWRDRDGYLSIDLVKLFPQTIREKEARYHLNLSAIATRCTQRIPYAAFLPWSETCQVVKPYLQNPDASLRILALKTLIDTVRYNRNQLPELLQIIQQRSNEQDPVRNAMLKGLANLPHSIWQQKHLTGLAEILTDALTAADLSDATAKEAQRIVINILPFHAQWSAQWLSELVKARGKISFFNLEDRLNNSQVQQLAPILLPVFKSWETREREWNLIEAAASFGKRLQVFDGLVDILERILFDTRDKWNATRILSILDNYRRDRLQFLIPQLLQQDKSWFTQSVVNQYLHNFRQDLLTPFLGQTAYRGKFSTGKTRFVPYFYRGFSRWTFKQQTIFAKSLDELTRDGKRDTPAVWNAIEQLSLLPAIEPTRLTQLASIKNPQQAVRDRAIRALSSLDGGQGVPILLEALDDARARIAIYALRTCLMEMPVERAVSILQNASWEKITVAKEIVRLLGDLPSETAYQELLAWNERDLHRDVKIALLRALWEHLEKERTWEVLEQAATSGDEAIATMIARTPSHSRFHGLSDKAQAKLISLLVNLLKRSEPTLRVAVLRRCYQLPVTDTKGALLPQLLNSLNSVYPDEVADAANAVFATYGDAELISEAIQQIIPNRRSLHIAIAQRLAYGETANLQNRLHWYGREFLPLLRAILSVMAIDPLTASLRIQLAIASLPWKEVGQFLIELSNKGELHADALTTAINAIATVNRRGDLVNIDELETILNNSEDEKLRRIALSALIAQANTILGWNQARIDRLLSYRQDNSILVAAAAQFTFPPNEIMSDN
ncbi:conserved hypothetical protein [Hyella patelloides LEGE 07179]|uniref:HEAT repeat domain-containing protein n=1 Tax=Hyella patelloides LEGE 07179 TaxID=945734 RepID=A0A563W5P1_9CYAN|nr:hypothetical protein [Hyella patelloides]VEP18984.1 conserved hypothetical protein [Hyella patelloides LEGE 07179]